MDRLRSLQYFIASAQEGSFSAAARRLEVTVPAVARLVNALELDLGVRLFDRSAQGLALTASGESYLESCQPALAALTDADEQMRATSARARGIVVVGVQHVAAKNLLVPALPRFHARHPEIQVDLRESTQMVHPDAPGVDVLISYTWIKPADMIHRAIATSSFKVCASPAYWAANGMPREPRELVHHNCLLIRTQAGTVMDVWKFARAGVVEEVTVKGWFVCNNAHRDSAITLAVAGEGVVRLLDWATQSDIESGQLVAAFTEWDAIEAPPVTLSYRPSVRRVARVKVFIEFVLDFFRELATPVRSGTTTTAAPAWARSTAGRASSLPRLRR